MARSNPTDEDSAESDDGGRFDPGTSLVDNLPGGWCHDVSASEAATEEAHAACVHVFGFDGPYIVRVVQVREANEYSVQRRQTSEHDDGDGSAPEEGTLGFTDPCGRRIAAAAARVMMAEVTDHYTEDQL
jgi:hypothetical protein